MGMNDKVAVVTGGGRGIGKAIALAFSREGAKVAVWARTEEQVAGVAGEILEAGGVAAHYVVDVADEKAVAETVARVEEELGHIDILVNNAAEMRLASITGTTVAIWDRLMRSNVRGPFVCCRAVLAGMMERRRGRIINIGSLAGRRGYEAQGAYCASKHALVGLSKVLAIEAQPYGVHVNMVSPGGVVTELSRELRESRGSDNPTDWMSAEEVAEAVLYIVKQEGAAVTDELVLRRFASEPWR